MGTRREVPFEHLQEPAVGPDRRAGKWGLTGFATTATSEVGGALYSASRIISHPALGSAFLPDNDLGLIELSSAVVGVDPVSLWRAGGRNSILGGETTWVGFGFGGTGLTGASTDLSTIAKRDFTDVADAFGDSIGANPTQFIADFDQPGTGGVVTALEDNVTPGDSGGGVFIEKGGQALLVGISATRSEFDGVLDSAYGDYSGASHLYDFLSWIELKTGIAAVPEPGWVSLGTCALLCFPRRRRPCCDGRCGAGIPSSRWSPSCRPSRSGGTQRGRCLGHLHRSCNSPLSLR